MNAILQILHSTAHFNFTLLCNCSLLYQMNNHTLDQLRYFCLATLIFTLYTVFTLQFTSFIMQVNPFLFPFFLFLSLYPSSFSFVMFCVLMYFFSFFLRLLFFSFMIASTRAASRCRCLAATNTCTCTCSLSLFSFFLSPRVLVCVFTYNRAMIV